MRETRNAREGLVQKFEGTMREYTATCVDNGSTSPKGYLRVIDFQRAKILCTSMREFDKVYKTAARQVPGDVECIFSLCKQFGIFTILTYNT